MIKSEPSVLYNEHKLSIFIILFYFAVIEIKELLDPRASWKNHQWISGFDWWMFSEFWEPRSVLSTKTGSVVYQDWVFDFVENLQLLNSKNRLNMLSFGGLFQCWFWFLVLKGTFDLGFNFFFFFSFLMETLV